MLAGTRTPKPSTLDALARGMGLDPIERNYLDLLVELASAQSVEARRVVLRKITSRVAYGHKVATEDDPDRYARYMARWYHVAIRELARLPGFRPEPEWVARTMVPPIGVDQAAAALDLLFELGLLVRAADGSVEAPEIRLESKPEVRSESLVRYYEEVVPHMLARLRDVPANQRQFVTVATALTTDGFAEARQIVWQLLDKVGAIGDADDPSGDRRVYQVALMFVPLTQPVD